MRRPQITFLMPVKNGMPYIIETLASLTSQTHKNFTVFAWDNGSSDGTVEELAKWIPNRLPGRLFVNDPRTLGGSLAQLVLAADTVYCARIDADDRCLPGRIESQLAYLSNNPEVDVFGGQLNLIDSSGVALGRQFSYPCSHMDIVCQMLSRNPFGHPSVMFRREAVLAAGNYDSEADLEDYDLWLRMARTARLGNLPEILVDYRLREESYTRQAERAGLMKNRMAATLSLHAQKLFGLSPDEVGALANRQVTSSFRMGRRIANHLASLLECPSSEVLSNRYFIESMLSYTTDNDLISHIRYAHRLEGITGVGHMAKFRMRGAISAFKGKLQGKILR
jgi:glycosyltransferase involved in cell wall biosynthesis